MGRRGPPHHKKRIAANYNWLLAKTKGIYAPHVSAGPHTSKESIPLLILLRNRLKYALTRKEAILIAMARAIKVDNKVRTDINFPISIMDVLTISETGENFRLLYDLKGHFVLHRIDSKESSYKLCKVKKQYMSTGGVPMIVTDDGRSIRYPHPSIKVNDTIKLNLSDSSNSSNASAIESVIKFDIGNLAIVTRGHNIGKIGIVTKLEKHIGGFDIAHLKSIDGSDNFSSDSENFATRVSNVFIIGNKNKPEISLPRSKKH